MRRSKRFEPIQEIADSAATELSRSMGDAARKVAELERQLDQLNTYRNEYLRGTVAGSAAMDAVKLLNYRSFLGRIGEALRLHVVKLDAARAEYERRRAVWSEKRIEAEALGRAVERFRQQEQHAVEQREQRDGDEAAMRMALARRTPEDP